MCNQTCAMTTLTSFNLCFLPASDGVLLFLIPILSLFVTGKVLMFLQWSKYIARHGITFGINQKFVVEFENPIIHP